MTLTRPGHPRNPPPRGRRGPAGQEPWLSQNPARSTPKVLTGLILSVMCLQFLEREAKGRFSGWCKGHLPTRHKGATGQELAGR